VARALVCLVFGLVLGGGAERAFDRLTRPTPEFNVVLLVIDCLRADHVGCYGYDRDTTPNIDSLAARGTVYTNHKSQSSTTTMSMASLFASRLVPVNYVPPRSDTLAEVLGDFGFHCGAVQTNPRLVVKRGYARGMDEYRLILEGRGLADGRWWRSVDSAGRALLDPRRYRADALEVLPPAERFIRESPRPFFLYVHYMDAHAPYAPREEFDVFSAKATTPEEKVRISGNFLTAGYREEFGEARRLRRQAIDLYDGGIRQADHSIGAILAALEDRGIYDDTMVIVTGDHGEAFLEHGRVQHSNGLHEELIHLPLVVKMPRRGASRVFNGLSRHIDIVPTVLNELGFRKRWRRKYTFAGRPLQETTGRGSNDRSKAFLMKEVEGQGFYVYGSVEDANTGFKLIVEKARDNSGGGETILLYNLRKDRGETLDQAALLPNVVRELWPLLPRVRSMRYDAFERKLRREMTEEQKARLRALGYLN
jgi:arylsulfatase